MQTLSCQSTETRERPWLGLPIFDCLCFILYALFAELVQVVSPYCLLVVCLPGCKCDSLVILPRLPTTLCIFPASISTWGHIGGYANQCLESYVQGFLRAQRDCSLLSV